MFHGGRALHGTVKQLEALKGRSLPGGEAELGDFVGTKATPLVSGCMVENVSLSNCVILTGRNSLTKVIAWQRFWICKTMSFGLYLKFVFS